MDKIKNQSSKVGELIFSADTGAAYKKTLVLTWAILRETGILLWLILCLVFVGAEWFWQTAIALGGKARIWYEGLQSADKQEPKSAGEMGQSIMDTLGTGTANLLYRAKQQLGMDAEPPAPKAPKATAPPTPTPAPKPVAAPPPAPPQAPPVAADAESADATEAEDAD